MSILIKGMEMPKEDSWKTVRIYPDGSCAVPNLQGDCTLIKGAQAVHVPPHGRLIDADALAEHKFVCIPHVTIDGKDVGTAYRLGWNTAIEAVMENAETIMGGE